MANNELIKPAKAKEPEPKEDKPSAVVVNAEIITSSVNIKRFRSHPMLLEPWPFPHYVPLTREAFNDIAYPRLGGKTRSQIADTFAYLASTVENLSSNDYLILFGPTEAQEDEAYHAQAVTRVWDTRRLEFVDNDPETTVWRSPYGVIQPSIPKPIPFVMSLAGHDAGKYDDIMQSLAPMIMERKPDGVIWWVGDGANGKSTLMDAIYQLFPGQLSSLTVKSLTGGSDAPRLNGTLANIVKESSEGRIDDTEIYKAVGTHEDFSTHKFHSQEMTVVRGNIHHIFSANNIPVFNDKGHSARRRTFIVPFTQRFESDPSFEERTFNAELFGRLIAEMCRYAVKLRDQGYKYKFSDETLGAKTEYDAETNNAEEYAKNVIGEGVVAFDSFNPIRMDYDNWCADMGYVPLGIGNLRKAVKAAGFERITVRADDSKTDKMYRLRTVEAGELQALGLGRPGLYTVPGFVPTKEPEVPEFKKPAEDELAPETTEETTFKSILNDRW